ncbi:unnamed protein product [Allacma fusca]|uniref:Aminopeptidase n=1 Tax=Allacma fusca TaxID=39272 RepID=A0A8J2JAL1_9HEXA|nr:unnamed protein product [Allacma fusca]
MPSTNPSLEIKLVSLVCATFVVFGIAKLVYPELSLRSQEEQLLPNTSESVLGLSQKLIKSDDFLSDIEEYTYRLPKDILPIKYFLKIQPIIPFVAENDTQYDFAGTNFTMYSVPGQVNISFDCVQETNKIIMHESSISIDMDNVKVYQLQDVDDTGSLNYEEFVEEILITDQDLEPVQHFYIIELGQNLQPGKKYLVVVPFTSQLSTQHTVGLFMTNYNDGPERKLMVGTKFQATHARQAFPCLDEPSFKAEFEITIGRPYNYNSLSNAPLRSTTENTELEGWYWDHYEPTVKMPTYLVCMAVCDFDSAEADPSLTNGREIKVWAPKTLINKGGGAYAANLTARVISFFEEYFNMTDPMPKVDSIMIPEFKTSAMENWGLITYKETMLIYVPGENTEFRRKMVTTVVAHELSHHWFGNLVTCDWWWDLWLNEGFATYLSFLVMEHLHPEFEPDKEFADDIYQLALQIDFYPHFSAVRNTARTPEEIDSTFNRISYRKGASIIRMVESFLGKENLRQALEAFIKKHAYQTAVQDDLFEELNVVGQSLLPAGITVKDILDTWTLKRGFPLVRVEALNNSTVRLSQEVFSLSVKEQPTNNSASWWVPITIASSKSQNVTSAPVAWIPSNTASIVVENMDTSDWIVVNYNLSGYFVTLYDSDLTKKLHKQFETNHLVFHPITRSQILLDYTFCVHSGYAPVQSAMEFTRYLGKETEYIPWNAILPFLTDLSRRLRASKERHNMLIKYMVPKLEQVLKLPQFGALPKKNVTEPVTVMHLRTELLLLACELESEFCYTEARRMIKEWMTNPDVNPVPAYMENIYMCAFIKSGGVEIWEFIRERSKHAKSEQSKWWFERSLGDCPESDEVIFKALAEFSGPGTDRAIQSDWMGNLARNKYAMVHTFDFIIENFEAHTDSSNEGGPRASISPEFFSEVFTSLGSYLYEPKHIQRARKFLAENEAKLNVYAKYVKMSIDKMEDNLSWMTTYGDFYYNWLEANL